MAPDDQHRPSTSSLARAAAAPAQFVLGAYSGEHGVYGVVLVSALIAVGWEEETDLDVLLFVLGTVVIFWIAHLYAAVVASRATPEGRRRPIGPTIVVAMRHSIGMLVATLLPVAVLTLGVLGWVEEYTAYYIALASGVVVLALIGFANATRNRSSWPLRLAGAGITASLGILVIFLSILTH
jgi:positive regulator of sigma E activity